MTRTVVLFFFVLIAGNVNCNLIKSVQEIVTKDVPTSREDIDNNDLKVPEETYTDVIPLAVGTDSREPVRDCAKIGQFVSFTYLTSN